MKIANGSLNDQEVFPPNIMNMSFILARIPQIFQIYGSKILLILSWKLEHYDLVQARIWTLSLQTENMAEHFKLIGDKSPLSTYVPSGMHSTCQGLACLI